MRVDFYQLTRDPPEAVLPLIARATLGQRQRLLVVSADPAQREKLSEALWTRLPETFLAHGNAGEPDAERQPILLAETPDEPANAARYIALADGEWRDEALTFERAFLLFGEATIAAARTHWRALGEQVDLERHLWKREAGGWREVA